jgi:hypothetical protein
MAHFAQLDENNTVLQVIVVANEELLASNGQESETKGIFFCQTLFGSETKWVQTSYNGNIRKNYAGIGYTYDPTADHFFAPQPYASWVLNNDAQWEAPVAYPTDGKAYTWNEDTQEWDLITPEGA